MSDDFAVETEHEIPGDALERGYDDKIAGELSMGKDVLRDLLSHYPGYRWRVVVNFRQGVCGISLPIFMGPVQFYAIPLSKMLTAADATKSVREAGGHILERLRLSRCGLRLDEYLDLRAKKRIIRPLDIIPQ